MFSEELDSQLVCLRNGLSTNVLRPNKMQTWIEHGRTKRTNVLRPKLSAVVALYHPRLLHGFAQVTKSALSLKCKLPLSTSTCW